MGLGETFEDIEYIDPIHKDRKIDRIIFYSFKSSSLETMLTAPILHHYIMLKWDIYKSESEVQIYEIICGDLGWWCYS